VRRSLAALAAALATAALAALAAATPAAALDGLIVPRFEDATAASGVESIYEGDWEFMVGGGVASFDCDGDGFPDLLLAGGAAPARLFRNRSAVGGPLRFEPAESGLEVEGVTGAYPLDVDGDGITDLVLLRVGENLAMRGLGDCRFERANEAWGFDGGDAWSAAMAATWEAGADWPTIAIGNYIDREAVMPWGSCTDNWLHRPGAAGRFAEPVALRPSHCALSMLFTDWDRSGRPALRVSNDREYYKGGEEQLWRLEPGAPLEAFTAADGWQSLRIWGMGIAARDLTGDGYPEFFLTSMADNKLQALARAEGDGQPAPRYDDIAFARGVTAHRPHTGEDIRPSTAWHAQFEDVNNDGRADLFVAKGNVAEMPDFAHDDPNNLLLQRPDGTFVEAGAAAGVASMGIARGAALVDLDLDGRVDLVVVNRWSPAEILRNTGPAGNWLAVRLEQAGANRDAIGAWIELRAGETVTRREVTVGGGHAGGQIGWWHFGLGEAERAEVRVIWPGGETGGEAGAWEALDAGAFYRLERGRPAAVWGPG
jgi:hypothetical protein